MTPPSLSAANASAVEPGLLFHLSGSQELRADFAASGQVEPTIARGVTAIPDGVAGAALQCADNQVLAYWAPGNIHAQRGTLAFFWRSRYPVGPTEFPIFRVAFADHSSWDMTWLRIDYNGEGFDAFVTDASLARTRVSAKQQPFPTPETWTHLAFSWDETRGVRLYVNGQLAAEKQAVAVYDVGLDQFGPHSRIISPHQVQSAYNFVRGGDLDELRIYDRMLTDAQVAALARAESAAGLTALPTRTLDDPATRAEWWLRHGWSDLKEAPPTLAEPFMRIRKVEIHDAFDVKRWWWKGTDGIRETTWPGVYNRSRLPGRLDYFVLPDWDCYVDSGKAITFVMPDEPWNHIEIAGAAWGRMELLPPGTDGRTASDVPAAGILFHRAARQERSTHRLAAPLRGRQIRFTNQEQEQPIGELGAYHVTGGRAPAGDSELRFRIGAPDHHDSRLASVNEFIERRYPADERTRLVAQPVEGEAASRLPPPANSAPAGSRAALPIVHVLVPANWDAIDGGLDGVVLALPAMPLRPTHGDVVPMNLQVKDPSWLYRNALDFSFSVRPGEARTLWLDLRDRLLPAGKSFYLTLAVAGEDFSPAWLEGAELRLVFKPRAATRPEHELDRFTQARDNYAMMAEEHPSTPRLNLWNRFHADLSELIRVNPDHEPGRYYAAAANLGPRVPPALTPPAAGVPLWAHRQVELLTRYQRFANWYVDHRQSAFGDFGGGLSDDTDLGNLFPGLALMGADPEKFSVALHRLLEACYENGMITNGLSTIQSDELHTYEEGMNTLGQSLLLHYGSPRSLERAMENVRGLDHLTGINAAGHRHIRSSYFSGTRIAAEDPWGTARPNSYLALQPSELLVEFNGHPAAKKLLIELADGLLAHRKVDPVTGRVTVPATIRYRDDEETAAAGAGSGGGAAGASAYLFWTAWLATDDRRYLVPVLDAGLASVNANLLDRFDLRSTYAARGATPPVGPASPGRGGRAGRGARAGRGGGADVLAWQLSGDKAALVRSYEASIDDFDSKEYIYTHGNLWIDRVFAEGSRMADLQKSRLGGAVHNRNDLMSGHAVSWKFHAPATTRSAAFLIPDATPTRFTVIAHNLESQPVRVAMTGWNIDPGTWEITQGIDVDGDDRMDSVPVARTVTFERTTSVDITLAASATTILRLQLKTPGVPYWQRPDLGVDARDVVVNGRQVTVTVHSVGSVETPRANVSLVDRAGRTLARAPIPALAAPNDLQPKTVTIALTIPEGTPLGGAAVVIDNENQITEITRLNNRIELSLVPPALASASGAR